MKILLLKSKQICSEFAPIGILYIGSVLEQNGHKVKFLDSSVEKLSEFEFISYINEFRPDAVGITAMYTEINEIFLIAKNVKQISSKIKVIVGGPLASSIPKKVLENKYIDFVVVGEGELTIIELLKNINQIKNLKNISGIGYKMDGEINITSPREPLLNLDSIPYPARHLVNLENYISSFETWLGSTGKIHRGTNMIATRGCPYNCIYCDKNVFGRKWRSRSAKNIIDEIEFLVKTYNINAIMFNDDIFDFNQQWLSEFCNELINRKLNIIWGCNSRVNHAKKENYELMYKSGCRFVAFGIEFGNQHVLDFTKKGITKEQIVRAIDTAKGVGLRTIGYFMIGMLNETKAEIDETIQFAISLNLDAGGWGVVSPIEGTRLYHMASGKGLVNENSWFYADRNNASVNLTKDVPTKELTKLVNKAYWDFFWSRPSRRYPHFLCRVMILLFPLIYLFTRGKFRITFLYIDRIRRYLRIRLP